MPDDISIYRGDELLWPQIKIATKAWAKWRALRFYREFPAGDGLLLFSCRFVYLWGMGFPLDLISLSRDREVLYLEDSIVPGKIGPWVKDAYFVLEVAAGTVLTKNIRSGDRLNWK